ncbi:MAG: hypothetical protein V7K50_04970 [Nostoc sp.]|uniref:hypothetical protein n=1 Tax=Nostoc sp. TaxID=1180 RepID=UPI002FF780C5
MKISAIVKGSICLLGLVGVGNILAAPASAGQQAAARGAVTLVRASGASISVSGELTLPNNDYYGADGTTPGLVVTPAYGTGTSATDNETITSLTLTPAAVVEAAGTGNAFIQSAAKALDAAVAGGDIGAQAALIRTGAGANGLGGLE